MGANQAPNPQSPRPAPAQGRENLALIYQEVLTAITRFRSNRQVASDAGVFRSQMKAAFRAAEAAALASGYPVEDTRLGHFCRRGFPGRVDSQLRAIRSSPIGLGCLCRKSYSAATQRERSSFTASTAFWLAAILHRSPMCWRSSPCAWNWDTVAVIA